MSYPNPYHYSGASYVYPYSDPNEPLQSVPEEPRFNFPQNAYGYGVDYMPPQIGGGEYHTRLRPNINLSPHATKTAHRAAQHRKEAVEKATAIAEDTGFEDYDEATLASLAPDAGWNPTPIGSPAPPAPQGAVAPPTTPGGEGSPLSPITPDTPRPSVNIEHLFTPSPKAPDPPFKAAVFDVLGFKPVELPSPPPPPPPLLPPVPAPVSADSMPTDPACGDPSTSSKPVSNMPSSSSQADEEGDPDSGNGDACGNPGGEDTLESGGDSDEGPSSTRPSKKGRPNKNDEKRIHQLFEEVDNLFNGASVETGRTVSSLIERWNNLSKHGAKTSRWNGYQHYHRKNVKKERERAGLPDGNARQCYESFIQLPNWQEILEKFMELEMVMEDETIAQQQRGFKKLTESFQHLAQEASRDRVDSLIFLAGTSVNEDMSVSHLQGSGAMETFIPDMLRMPTSDFIGLAKAHIYKTTADDYMDDLVRTHGSPQNWMGDHKKPHRPSRAKPQVPLSDHLLVPQSDDDGDEYLLKHVDGCGRSIEDDRAECKAQFFKLFREHDLVIRGQETLPWGSLLSQLLSWGVQLVDWPAGVPFPSETVRRAHTGIQSRPSQGIKGLKSQPVRILLASFFDPKSRIKVKKGIPLHDLKKDKQPLIINAAPVEGSKQSTGRRQFASGTIDHKGPAALGPSPAATKRRSRKEKPVTKTEKGGGQPPPPDAEVLEISSASPPSNRTRGKAAQKARAIVESSDDDDDDAPLVRSKKSKTRVTKGVVELTSDEEDNELEEEAGVRDTAAGDGTNVVANGDGAKDAAEWEEVGGATGEGWNDTADPLDSDPDGLLAADPDDGDYRAHKKARYTKKSPKKNQKATAKGKVRGKARQTEVDNGVHQGRTVEVATPIPRTHPKVTQLPTPVAGPPLSETRHIPSGAPVAAAPAAPDPARVRLVVERFKSGGDMGLGRRPSAALENMEEPSPKRARTEARDVESEAAPPTSKEPSDLPAPQPGTTAQPSPSAEPRAPSVQPSMLSVPPRAPSTQPCAPSAQPRAPSAQPRARSAQPRAPSAPPPPMSRPPSTQPPHIPTVHPDVLPASLRPPHVYPGRMGSHYRSTPDDHVFPPARLLPPNIYLRGVARTGGTAGRGRPPYMAHHSMMHEETGAPGGHGRGHGRGTHLHPQSHDSTMHEDGPYYESFHSRRPTNHEGYYQGQTWEYDGYMGEDGYPPYPYAHRQPYPRYPVPGYGEAGPSRYHGEYNHGGPMVYNGTNDQAVAADNVNADPAAMQVEGAEGEGWADPQGILNPMDAE